MPCKADVACKQWLKLKGQFISLPTGEGSEVSFLMSHLRTRCHAFEHRTSVLCAGSFLLQKHSGS